MISYLLASAGTTAGATAAGTTDVVVTTAAAGIPQADHASAPGQGRTYAVALGVKGLPEHQVIL